MTVAPASPRLGLGSVRFPVSLVRFCRRAGAVLLLAWLAGGVSPVPARAQTAGSLDPEFNAIGELSDLTVFTLGVQDNGFGLDGSRVYGIIVGGDTRVLERATPSGLSDQIFTPSPYFGGSDRTVYTLAFETTFPGTDIGMSGSKIYVGGRFGKSTDPTTGHTLPYELNIVRLNSNGTTDTTFNPGGRGANDEVTAILPFPSALGGGLIVGGLFERYNGDEHEHIVKLKEDGTVDTDYNTSLSAGDTVFTLALQIDPATGAPNGQVLVAGSFNRINKAEPAKLARLNADGTTDTSFNPDFPTRAISVVCQPDGKILVGGDFDSVNGKGGFNNIVRLNQDGSIDPTFQASVTGNIEPANTPPTAVYFMRLSPDNTGRILMGGNFTTVNGVDHRFLARLNSDGSLDTSFNTGTTIQNFVQSIAVQPDGKILVAETRIKRPSDNAQYPPVVVRLYGGDVPNPTVSIFPVVKSAFRGSRRTATVPTTAGLPERDGRFEIFRTAPTADILNVSFTAAGTGEGYRLYLYNEATKMNSVTPIYYSGADPDNNKVMVGIPAFADHILISVVPTRRRRPQVGIEREHFTLQGSTDYTVGARDTATIKIRP